MLGPLVASGPKRPSETFLVFTRDYAVDPRRIRGDQYLELVRSFVKHADRRQNRYPIVVLVTALLLLGGAGEARASAIQQIGTSGLTEEDVEALIGGGTFEVGRTRTRQAENPQPGDESGSAETEAEETLDSLLDAAAGGATGGVGSTLDQARALLEASGLDGGALPSVPDADALESARALLEAYQPRAGVSEQVSPGGVGLPAADPPARAREQFLDAYRAARGIEPAEPGRPGGDQRSDRPGRSPSVNDQEAGRLPWQADRSESADTAAKLDPWAARGAAYEAATDARGSSGPTAGAAPGAGLWAGEDASDAARPTDASDDGSAAEPAVVADVAEAAPAEVASPGVEQATSYEEAISSREGDWFIVLGSFLIREGRDPLPSPSVDGTADPTGSPGINRVQQQLWDAGYEPWVVRSDALPGFADGLAVIVVGPTTQRDAAAEVAALRRIVPDVYIKAGW